MDIFDVLGKLSLIIQVPAVLSTKALIRECFLAEKRIEPEKAELVRNLPKSQVVFWDD